MGAHEWVGQRQLFEGSAAKQPQGLEGPSPTRRSAILGAERGRLKPTDGAGSPRTSACLLVPASRERFLVPPEARSGQEAGRAPTPLRAPLRDRGWPCGARLQQAPGAASAGFLLAP